jgi:hypothetical protein
MRKIPVLVTFMLAVFVSIPRTNAATPKEEYELQERCGKRAEEAFRREWGSTGMTNTTRDGQAVSAYRNHYNSTLHKCFVLLTARHLSRERNVLIGTTTQRTLYDINDSKDYGFFFKVDDDPPTQCRVAGKVCRSEAEWDSLVAPYMAD